MKSYKRISTKNEHICVGSLNYGTNKRLCRKNRAVAYVYLSRCTNIFMCIYQLISVMEVGTTIQFEILQE